MKGQVWPDTGRYGLPTMNNEQNKEYDASNITMLYPQCLIWRMPCRRVTIGFWAGPIFSQIHYLYQNEPPPK